MAEEFKDAEEIKLVQLLTDGEIRYKMCGKNEKWFFDDNIYDDAWRINTISSFILKIVGVLR